jgi:predicted nuclease with TOPRIM domain
VNHLEFPAYVVRVLSLSLLLPLLTAVGCGSDSTGIANADANVGQSELTKARDHADVAQAKLKDARRQAGLLAVKIESLVGERDTLRTERDSLRADVARAGEKFATVQTQFSELRARSAEFNAAMESLSQAISGTQDDAETGIAIIPRDVKEEDADSDQTDAFPTLYGPPELPASNRGTSVFANPEPETESE